MDCKVLAKIRRKVFSKLLKCEPEKVCYGDSQDGASQNFPTPKAFNQWQNNSIYSIFIHHFSFHSRRRQHQFQLFAYENLFFSFHFAIFCSPDSICDLQPDRLKKETSASGEEEKLVGHNLRAPFFKFEQKKRPRMKDGKKRNENRFGFRLFVIIPTC